MEQDSRGDAADGSHLFGEAMRGARIAHNTEHRFLISPQLGSIYLNFDLDAPPCLAHSVAFQVELLEP